MTTFVVRFVGEPALAFRGTARHVRTGEEIVFASPEELLAFFEQMAAVSGLGAVAGSDIESPVPIERRGPAGSRAPDRSGRGERRRKR